MADKIQIAVVDDHPLFRDGVVLVLSGHEAFDVVAEGASAEDAVRIADNMLPDVILLDVSMPGGGIRAAGEIFKRWPIIKIIMLTVSEDEEDVSAALKAGARGYVLKGIGGTELIETIKTIHRGEAYVSPALAARLLTDYRSGGSRGPSPADDFDSLSAREEQILNLLAKGMSNKEIGLDLNLSEKTVKHYMTNILQKLQVRNRVEAALLAQQRAATKQT